MKDDRLERFRQDIHHLLGKAKDATFELMDSVMSTRKANCLGEFALSPLFTRKWSSVYEALQDTRPRRKALMKRCIEEIPDSEYILLGIDHTGWERREAKTLKDRGYHYQASSKKGVSIGQGYSTIAWLPPEQGSWALPLRHERITSFETPISKAAEQLKQVSHQLQQKLLVVLDSEYGNGSWVNQTGELSVSRLMRIRSNCCLWSKPPAYSGRGRPRKHGAKFKVNDPTTWWEADEIVEVKDPKLGLVRLKKWKDVHFRSSASHPMSVIQLQKLNSKNLQKNSRPIWLVWVGEEFLALEKVWSQYARRFGVDHWYRFAKQRLHWTLPHLSTPEQSQRWSDLMPLMSWQLWLARDRVQQYHLPWQSPLTNLTPGRVAQSMFSLFVEIGSPTTSPKTRGKSPGWQKGRKRNKRKTYPLVKKRYSPPRKAKKKMA